MFMFGMTAYLERSGGGMHYYGFVRLRPMKLRPLECAFCGERQASGGCVDVSEAHFCENNPASGRQVPSD